MPLTGVLIEIRRNLRCANVFFTLSRRLSECESALSIIVNPDNITIKISERKWIVELEDIEVEINTLSTLVVNGRNISFRIMLANQTDVASPIHNSSNQYPTCNKNKVECKINKVLPCQIICRICETHLLKEFKVFDRICELPTGQIDVSNWFCHHGPNFDEILTPNSNDVFYGFYFIVLNKDNFYNCETKDNHVYCRRCLRYLGQSLYNNNAFKIWSDNIYLVQDDSRTSVFKLEDSYEILCNLINDILIDDASFDSQVRLFQFCKILLESVCPDRKTKYLMINIIDKNAEIFKELEIQNKNNTAVKLTACKGIKTYYKLEDWQQPLVKFWQNDFNVHNVAVSFPFFKYIFNVLEANSTIIPEIYRQSNDFSLSYIFLPHL